MMDLNRGAILSALVGAALLAPVAPQAFAATDRVPAFNVRASCQAAKAYNVMEDKDKTFNGCLQDEDRAHKLLVKNWSTFKSKDRQDCTAQVVRVAPSYVEILTCLEMSDQTGALLSKDVNQPIGRALPPDVMPDPLANEPLPSKVR